MIEYLYLFAPLTVLIEFGLKKDCKDMHHFFKYKSEIYICCEHQAKSHDPI